MEVPWLMMLGAFAPVLPILAAWWARRGASGGRRWILIWCGFLLLSLVAMRGLVLAGFQNLWLGYFLTPVEAVVALRALLLWQHRQLPRLMILIAIPASLVAFLILMAAEDVNAFSQLAAPMFALIGLAVALLTLVGRAVDESEPLHRQDWFWIAGGLAVYFGSTAALAPLAHILLEREDFALLTRAFMLKAVVDLLAFAAIAVGMTCPSSPDRQPLSGDSSLPAPSASV